MAWVKIARLARGTVTWLVLAAIASLVPAEVVVFVLRSWTGRRPLAQLKIPCPQGRVGSTPTSGIESRAAFSAARGG
jgi:hypothetical protein